MALSQLYTIQYSGICTTLLLGKAETVIVYIILFILITEKTDSKLRIYKPVIWISIQRAEEGSYIYIVLGVGGQNMSTAVIVS